MRRNEIKQDEDAKVKMQDIKDRQNRNNPLRSKEREQYVRLKEIGPRITMHLVKIEEKVNTGKVLYHRFITKTKQEIWTAEQTKLEKERERQRHILRQKIAEKMKEEEEKEKEEQRKERNSDRRLKR